MLRLTVTASLATENVARLSSDMAHLMAFGGGVLLSVYRFRPLRSNPA